jgi:O-antigen/teichoic acid export membrane protein
MVIPENRLYAANWVFQASILSFMFGLLSVPYNALIVAHERMSAFAYIGILEIVLRLAVVLFVAYCPFDFDKLIIYSVLLTGLGILMRFIYVSYCRRNFSESELQFNVDKNCLKQRILWLVFPIINKKISYISENDMYDNEFICF